MTVVIASNYFNHHQKPFCDAIIAKNINLFFVSTSQMRQERRALGYGMTDIPIYVKYSYTDENARQECLSLIQNADVVIWGSAPYELIEPRLKAGKLTLAYSERIYKQGFSVLRLPVRLIKHYRRFGKYKNLYLLCSSAYTAFDYSRTRCYIGKTYKWGYYPAVKRYESIERLIDEKNKKTLVWAARMIDWKHPELPILVAKRLKEEGYQFELSLIGNGQLEAEVKAQIIEANLQDCVKLLGSMKPEQVREHMESSQLFLFTSDRNEGWGAVLNEAMNSACAVVASHEIGSVPFLLEHEKNGLIYKDGDFESLYRAVKRLLNDDTLCDTLGREAYRTIAECWNADVAAERLLVLIEALRTNDTCDMFEGGPCSRAAILKDDWFEE